MHVRFKRILDSQGTETGKVCRTKLSMCGVTAPTPSSAGASSPGDEKNMPQPAQMFHLESLGIPWNPIFRSRQNVRYEAPDPADKKWLTMVDLVLPCEILRIMVVRIAWLSQKNGGRARKPEGPWRRGDGAGRSSARIGRTPSSIAYTHPQTGPQTGGPSTRSEHISRCKEPVRHHPSTTHTTRPVRIQARSNVKRVEGENPCYGGEPPNVLCFKVSIATPDVGWASIPGDVLEVISCGMVLEGRTCDRT